MCEFVSWVEKGQSVYFLTGKDLLETDRGREYREWNSGAHAVDDYTGHGAIRWYHKLEGGVDRECSDFSSPANFPSQIAEAIKRGLYRGLGHPQELLAQPALSDYHRITQPALSEYQRITQPALSEYQRIRRAAYADYHRITQPAYADYHRIRQAALSDYHRIEQAAFWDLFAVMENRNPNWR